MLKKTLLLLLAIGTYCLPVEALYASENIDKYISSDSDCTHMSLCMYKQGSLYKYEGNHCPQTLSEFKEKFPHKGAVYGPPRNQYYNCSSD